MTARSVPMARCLAAIALLATLLSSSAWAADDQGRYRTIGYGTRGCDDYAVAIGGGDDAGFDNWVAGYLTGINYAYQETYDIKGAADLPAVKDWLLSYCQQHVGDTLATAIHAFVTERYPTRKTSR